MSVLDQPVIAGLACRLPKSNNVEEFWNNLIQGKDMIDISRWPSGLFGMPPRAGLIKDVEKFDAQYFGFSDTEAVNMNPLLRHLYEVCYECLIDSGLSLEVLQNNCTGMYTACFLPGHDGLEVCRSANSKYCTTVDQITGHVMAELKLTGPMATVDTACSSSLSALEMAFTDLQLGRCQYAIVAGCNLLMNPSYIQMMMKLGMLNPTGQSNVFDGNAGGYVRAEGISAILITRNQAQCKRIYAVLVDVITGCDGYKEEGITFPNAISQSSMIKTLYKKAAVDVNDIAYMEAHSTGTKAGDPVEMSALSDAVCSSRREPLLVGSVKANMGHSEATAALASMMKCILAARHGVIPPQINYNVPNPKITAIQQGNIQIVNAPTPLKDGYIGLNSFGFGGANGHVILKPYKKSREKKECETISMMIPVTSRTEEELVNIGDYIKNSILNPTELSILATSYLSHDPLRPIRSYFVINPDTNDITQNTVQETPVVPEIWLYLQDFVWDKVQVSKEMLKNKVFEASFQKSQKILSDQGIDICLTDLLHLDEPVTSVSKQGMVLAVAALIGLVDIVKACHIHLSGVVSNGLSELVAGYVDGCLSHEESLKLAWTIGEVLEEAKQDPMHVVYLVKMKVEDIYLLGPKARILTLLSPSSIIIAVEKANKDIIEKQILNNGCVYQELEHSLPLYSHLLKKQTESTLPKLESCIKSPKLRSPHMLNGTTDFAYGHSSIVDSKVDGKYIREILTTPMLTNVSESLPADVLLLDIAISSIKMELPSDDTRVFDPITCEAKPFSVLQMLGQIHLHGHTVNPEELYKVAFPLDVTAPSISPLVRWDHKSSYPLPEWPEYYCRMKDEAVCPYIIDSSDVEGIHTPLGLLLYHTWSSINEKHQQKKEDTKIEFNKLCVKLESDVTLESLTDTVIQVQTGKQYFVAQNGGKVILSGYYKLPTGDMDIPIIPGLDQDINENIFIKEDDHELQKTEILWEDSWLDFIDTLLEFSSQWLPGSLTKIFIDPQSHMSRVKECANLLAVAEPCTGLCKAGSVALQTVVPKFSDRNKTVKVQNIGDAGNTRVSMLMAYNLEGGESSQNKVLIYQGETTHLKTQVIGIVLITGEEIVCRELPLSMGWRPEDLEQLLPYILAVYILCDVAELMPGQKLLVCPPIDTVNVYIMAVANEIGASVFTCSYDLEMRQLIDSIFPFVRVLPGQRLDQNIMTLTQGEGCDVCIKFTGGGLSEVLELSAINGKMIQCAVPSEREVNLGLLKPGSTFIVPELTKAVKRFLEKSADDIQTFLYSMQKGSISKLSTEGFPEMKGLKYSLEERSHFIEPVPFSLILTVMEDPGVNMSMLEGMTEADIMAMERLHHVITSQPKDCSLSDSRLALDSDDKENQYDSGNVLNIGQMDFSVYKCASSTPCGIKVCRILGSPDNPKSTEIPKEQVTQDQVLKVQDRKKSVPEIQVQSPVEEKPSFSEDDSSFKSPSDLDIKTPFSSTPASRSGTDNPDGGSEKPTSLIKVFKARRINMKKSSLAHLQIPENISSFKKGGSKLDLLFVGPPPTPITPAMKKLLTPTWSSSEPTIVPLNKKTDGPKLFMVHPITGKIILLKTLGRLLQTPCFGIQRTNSTPTKSIPCVASYYKNALEVHQPAGPYYIVGYSFGSVVAIEMALQMQEHGAKRACLILLDGSPQYFHTQFDAGISQAPKNASEIMKSEYLEIGALVTFLKMYTPKVNVAMVTKALLCLPNLDEKISTVVAMTFGNVLLSPNPVKTKWMAAKAKMKRIGLLTPAVIPIAGEKNKFGFEDAAEEIIKLKRTKAAKDIVNSVHILYNYRNSGKKIQGDIYLLRIKDDVGGCTDLAADYGLQDWCTGTVHLRFYDGTHESFLNEVSGEAVAQEIAEIVKECSA